MLKIGILTNYDESREKAWAKGPYEGLLASAVLEPGEHSVTDDLDSADLIIMADDGGIPAPLFQMFNPVLRRFWRKTFLYSEDFGIFPVCPGIYTGLSIIDHKEDWNVGGWYVRPEVCGWSKPLPLSIERTRLFSFNGSIETHPVRTAILNSFTHKGWICGQSRKEVQDAFTYGQADRIKQLQEEFESSALTSNFVLCPRGVAPSSIRLFEVMSMARAPVIISDEWVPPSGPAWDAFSIRVSEADVSRLEDLLMRHQNRSVEMGLRAREEWEKWFSPAVHFKRIVDACLKIQSYGKTRSATHYLRQWYRAFNFTSLKGAVRYVKSKW